MGRMREFAPFASSHWPAIAVGGSTAIGSTSDERQVSRYSVEKLEFACAPQVNRGYEAAGFRSVSAGPTAIEIAPASLCVALKAIDATRATCDPQLGFRRPHV